MGKGRLEAFSDGVIAIIITIMVLELKVPHETSLAALTALWPVFFSYILSFLNVAIYWNNHHHLMHAVKRVTGGMLWANAHLLFWLSLFPFTAGWMGENHFASLPVALYGVNFLACAIAYTILVRVILKSHGQDSDIAKAIGNDAKGTVSLLLYAIAIPLAFYFPWVAGGLYLTVALIWLIPDRRIEKALRT
jgi:uncharacterized membrane protein